MSCYGVLDSDNKVERRTKKVEIKTSENSDRYIQLREFIINLVVRMSCHHNRRENLFEKLKTFYYLKHRRMTVQQCQM